jgi:Fe-S-cluster formation regulator IscX/YfhJ
MGKKTDYVVDKETAIKEYERFVDLMDLDVDLDDMDDDDKREFTDHQRIILRAIRRGHLAIDEKGQPVYTTQREPKAGETLVFKEPNGAALMAMDRKKNHEDVGKMYATMGQITGTNAKTFSLMAYPDLKVCTAVVTLFLA